MNIRRRTAITYIALMAVFSGLNIAITSLISIPLAVGYFNPGDILIYLTATLLHPLIGAVVGAVSGGVSDLILGFGSYFPYTVLIKGLEALIVGYFFRLLAKKTKKFSLYFLIPINIIGALFMVGGYYLAEILIYDSFTVPLGSLPMNLLQGGISAGVASVLFYTLFKLPILSTIDICANASFLSHLGA